MTLYLTRKNPEGQEWKEFDSYVTLLGSNVVDVIFHSQMVQIFLRCDVLKCYNNWNHMYDCICLASKVF